MTPTPPDQSKGLRCSRCHCCDLRTLKTLPAPGGKVKRYKQCRACGQRLTTFEVRPADLPR